MVGNGPFESDAAFMFFIPLFFSFAIVHDEKNRSGQPFYRII